MSIARGAAAAVAPGSGPRGGERAGGGRGHALVPLEVDERPLIAVRTGHLEEHDVPGAHHRRGPRRRLRRRRGRAGQTAKLEGIVGRHDATREGDRRDATRTHVRRGERDAPDVRVARAGGVRRRGHPRGGWGARSREVERREVRPTAILCQFPKLQILWTLTVGTPEGEFQTGYYTPGARTRTGATRRVSSLGARHARGRPEPRAVLDAHRRGRSRLRRDTPPRRRRPRRAPPPSKPPRVLREEARLRAEAEALLARMSSEATRAKTLAAATATAAASTRTIPAPKHSSARGDLPAPRRRGDAPRPDPSRHPQRPDARRRSLREPRAAHPEPPPRAPRDPSLERVAREAVERARRRLADAQTARVETDEASSPSRRRRRRRRRRENPSRRRGRRGGRRATRRADRRGDRRAREKRTRAQKYSTPALEPAHEPSSASRASAARAARCCSRARRASTSPRNRT